MPQPTDQHPQHHGAWHPAPRGSSKEIQAGRQALPKATSRLHLCQHRATPARIAPRKGAGSGAGPGAAGTRLGPSAHGEECSCLRLARPARAAPRTQAWLSAKPGACGGGVL